MTGAQSFTCVASVQRKFDELAGFSLLKLEMTFVSPIALACVCHVIVVVRVFANNLLSLCREFCFARWERPKWPSIVM